MHLSPLRDNCEWGTPPVKARLHATISKTFLSLRTRNFRLFYTGQLVSNTGNWLTNLALTLLILHLTNSGVAVGLLTACQYGPILLLSAWGGAIADRSNKRNLLMITQALELGQSCVLAVLAFMPHPPLAALFITASVGGVFLAFDNPVRRSFVTEMVPAEDLPNAVVLYSALVNTSRLIGPALAGLLVVTLGYGWCFTIDAISYVTVLIALAMMRPAELRRVPATPRAKGQVRAAVRYVAAKRELRIPFIMLGVIGVFSYNFNVVFPLFSETTLGASDGEFTLLYTVFSAGSLLSALVVANRRLIQLRNVIIGATALGAALTVFALSPDLAAAYPFIFLVGVSSILFMTATTSIVQVVADQAMHGRVLALQTVLMIGSAPIGGPLMGLIADTFGARSTVAIGAVGALSAATWGRIAARRNRPDPGRPGRLDMSPGG